MIILFLNRIKLRLLPFGNLYKTKQVVVFCILFSFSVPVISQTTMENFPNWQKGYLDIHHINSGMGDCTFFVFPDGTTMLFDAGEMDITNSRIKGPRNAKPKPNAIKTPGEWLAHYIKNVQKKLPKKQIDYAAISHFHGDHMGTPHPLSPTSKSGNYKLTGITTIGEMIKINKLLDRGWPNYDYPAPINNAMMSNYRSFIDWQRSNNGMLVEKFEAGSNDQISLLYDKDQYPNFEVRNISVNGEVWTGVASNTRANFPDINPLKNKDAWRPGENPCSISFRISYGKFDYFTGGDIPGVLSPGQPLWQDIETPVAKAVGPVEVNVLNHHGNKDSQNSFFLESLRPRVHIMSVWSSDHPGDTVLSRLLNENIYPGPRDIFATNMLEANYQVIGSNLKKLKSSQGHIVVRVLPGGESYYVIILDDSDTDYKIKATFGPYVSR